MTKIDIISGFLGAGKTTFIKKMIDEAFKGEQIVLIENEFGEVGIDGGFLKDAGIQITEMNSGCICCSLVGDFGKNLNEVITKYHPDRILIEPSGVGKLSDVMKSVIDIEKEQPVKLNALVTVVNALKASKQMKAFGEFFNNQIEYATTVILSRSQNATPEQLEFCVKQIQALNPKASVITTDWDAIKGEQILKTMEGQDNLEMKVLAEARHAQDEAEHHHHHDEHCSCGCEDHKHEHHEHEHLHHHDEHCGCGCGDHEHHGHSHNALTAKRVYILENLGCAHCASKMEERIQALEGVESATITFATKQLRLGAADPDALLPQIRKICTSIESEVKVVPRNPAPAASTDTTTKTYLLENLGCAHCASKMEEQIANLEGISEATITFATKQLRLTAKNPDRYLDQIRKICTSIESEVLVKEKDPKPKAQSPKTVTHTTVSKKKFFSKENVDII